MIRLLIATMALLAAGFLTTINPATAVASELPQPKNKVVLVVTGQIASSNSQEGAAFDLDMLRALPQSSFVTKTIWTEGENTFTGVPLRALLDAVGATGKNLRAVALNDYAVDIPVADAVADGPLVAYSIDGRELPVRNRGPLWIVYPYDAKADYRSEVIYSRSIWQLKRIDVTD